MLHKRYQNKDEHQIPESLLNEPVLIEGLEIYYEGFWDLSPDRPLGMSAGPIPYQSIRYYCKDLGLDEAQSDLMKKMIRKMDICFLEWQEKQASKGRKMKGK